MEVIMWMILVCLVLAAIAGLIENAQEKDFKKKLDKELEEKKKTFAIIEFAVPTEGSLLRTKIIEAGVVFRTVVSAKSVAEHNLARYFEKGYIKDHNGVSYPTCNVKYARVVEKSWKDI